MSDRYVRDSPEERQADADRGKMAGCALLLLLIILFIGWLIHA
jgi:hypothetical protein